MRLLCVSDIHGQVRSIQALLEAEKRGTDCIILCGDLTQSGDYAKAGEVVEPFIASRLKVIAVHGNMDTEGVAQFLAEQGVSIHGITVEYEGVSFTGLGGGVTSPLDTPIEYSEDEIKEILDCAGLSDSGLVRVLVSHTPPKDTLLDRLGSGRHAGSRSVRDYILSKNISLCISGHIHESSGIDRIGSCSCVNTGAFKEGKYGVIELDVKTGESEIRLARL